MLKWESHSMHLHLLQLVHYDLVHVFSSVLILMKPILLLLELLVSHHLVICNVLLLVAFVSFLLLVMLAFLVLNLRCLLLTLFSLSLL